MTAHIPSPEDHEPFKPIVSPATAKELAKAGITEGYEVMEKLLTTAASLPDAPALPGEQWVPSNGTEGMAFIESWCSNCARDDISHGARDENDEPLHTCRILTKSFFGEAVEWRKLGDGGLVCTAFLRLSDPPVTPRCERTVDMFSTTNNEKK